MHDREEDAHEQETSGVVADLLLKKPPEIYFLWKRDASKLIKDRTRRGENKDFPGFQGKITERKEYDQGGKETHSDISQREPEVNPLSHDVGSGKEKDRDQIFE